MADWVVVPIETHGDNDQHCADDCEFLSTATDYCNLFDVSLSVEDLPCELCGTENAIRLRLRDMHCHEAECELVKK